MSLSNNGNGKELTTLLKEAQFNLGIKIVSCRRRANMEQQELADRCNELRLTTLTQPRVSAIERGETQASFIEIQAIADVFSKDLNEFRV
jgi:transcriptional regulator with XRE-family HTH domain